VDDPKAWARELAETTRHQMGVPIYESDIAWIESAILTGMRELLAREPSEAMLDVAVSFALCVQVSGEYRWSEYTRDMWKRMAAELAKEL
jgi:hypothetical protein